MMFTYIFILIICLFIAYNIGFVKKHAKLNAYHKNSYDYSVDQAHTILEKTVSSKNYKYQLPLYLSAGNTQNIKHIFDNIGLDTIAANYCSNQTNWYFYNQGVVANLNENGDLNQFLSILNIQREKEPINGVIYFISIEDLIKENELEFNKAHDYLNSINQAFAIKTPVYFVFNNIEKLEYFNVFIKHLDSKKINSIFGCNTKNMQFVMNAENIKDLFESWKNELYLIKQEMLLKVDEDSAFKIICFFEQLYNLQNALIKCFGIIFKNNINESAYYCNGFYFHAQDTNKTIKSGSLAFQEIQTQYFMQDLLQSKIFQEAELVRYSFSLKYNNRILFYFKSFIFGFIIFAFFYLINFNYSLYKTNYKYQDKIHACIKLNQKIQETKSEKEFDENLNLIINLLAEISEIDLKYRFIPSYWLSNIEYKYELLFHQVIEKNIVDNLLHKINYKYKTLNSNVLYSNNDFFNSPVDSTSFAQLNEYVEKLVFLEKSELELNTIVENGDFELFEKLIYNFFNIKIQLKYNKKLLKNILKNIQIDSEILYKEKQQSVIVLTKLSDYFFSNGFNCKYFFKNFQEIENLILKLNNNEKLEYFELQILRNSVFEICNLLSSNLQWINKSSYNPDKMQNLIKKLNQLKYLNYKYVKDIEQKVHINFLQFKKDLNELKLHNIGYFLTNKNNQFKVSDEMYEFLGYLNILFAQSFMSNEIVREFNSAQISSMWNINALKEVHNLIKEYEMVCKILYENNSLKIITQETGMQNLNKLIETKLSQAEVSYPIEMKDLYLADYSENYVSSYQYITEILNYLKIHNHSLFYKLKNYERNKVLNYLNILKFNVGFNNIYIINEYNIEIDYISKNLFFNINIFEFLTNNKKKIEYYAKTLALPAITLLKTLDRFDNISSDTTATEWESIINDLYYYESNNQLSALFELEKHVQSLDNLSINLILAKIKHCKKQKDCNYFDKKFNNIITIIESRLHSLAQKFLSKSYNDCYEYYNLYSEFFPFDLNGDFLNFSGFQRLQDLIKRQKIEFELIKLLNPDIMNYHFYFVNNLFSMEKLIDFSINNNKKMLFKINKYSNKTFVFERNLKYLVSIKAHTNNSAKYNVLYSANEFVVEDNINFEFELSNITNLAFDSHKNSVTEGNILKFNFNKLNFIKFLIENTVEIDSEYYLKFELNAIDNQGIKKQIIIHLPYQASIDKELLKISKFNLNQLKKDVIINE